ncbi:MAG TPA: hypothetical protein VFP80_15670, partial [Thermoanaerobaculia bacterium]|nr:hypothetical protein [Thermoanaerobaculia bacterium]
MNPTVNLTEPFVLQSDVALCPCADLGEDTRRRITFDDGDFALSRRLGRGLAQVIDGDTAALLALFREPCTIVDAVIENSRACGSDPEARLDELLPHLERFVHSRILVPAGSVEEDALQPRYESGAQIAGWTVVRCASLVEDTEIYEVKRTAGVPPAAGPASRRPVAASSRVRAGETPPAQP